MVLGAFGYYGETGYMLWFFAFHLLLLAARQKLSSLFKQASEVDYRSFINAYVVIVFLLGCNWAVLNLAYYDIANEELKTFLPFISVALVSAGIGALSSWMPAYYGFSLPLMTSLVIVFILNSNFFVAFGLIPFALFINFVAVSANTRFKESRLLALDNIELIDRMYEEIDRTEDAKKKLEDYKNELESLVEERTSALSEANKDLQEQIEQRSRVEKDLEHLAYYDVLTGLPNRSLLIERLKQAVSVAKRQQSLFSVLFIDLDRFKAINDSLGHDFGDRLLTLVADRLKNLLRESDTVARNGGDEFVVLIENMSDVREAFVVAEKIIGAMSEIFTIDSHEIHIGASVGVSLYPLDGQNALELLKMSDTAMYSAKERGTNQFEFYSSHMSSQIKDRLAIETALRSAEKNNELFMVYQPQVDLTSQKTTGFEALIRWKNPKLGFVPPDKFIPVLEETGLIYQIGEWIIREVFEFINQGYSQGCKVSINLSALQCSSFQFTSVIEKYLEQYAVEAAQVEFEITESVLINDFKKTEKFLNRIHELGCTIALDDFGTGYTSFSYLTRLAIDVIKIDRSMVTDIDQRQNLEDIVRAMITMSQSLRIENVFEGVETEAELQKIRELGGRIIQGYYYSQPLEASDVGNWFKQQKTDNKQAGGLS